jgi:hypothetical protein
MERFQTAGEECIKAITKGCGGEINFLDAQAMVATLSGDPAGFRAGVDEVGIVDGSLLK